MVKEILTNKLKNEKDALEKYLLEHIWK
jgi:hypothetical protein